MQDVFFYLPKGAVKLHGPIGKALDLTVANRLKKINYKHLADPFRYRRESDNLWRCEFWGKIVRSAIHCWRATLDPELLKLIKATVKDIISTQTSDGCISSYPPEKQLGGWDIWGRKYVLHGLVRYYEEVAPDPAVAASCTKLVDHLIKQIGKRDLRTLGQHFGLAPCSILDGICGVYRITGKKRFLDFARKIAESGCSMIGNVYEQALAGVPPAYTGNGKAYELTSCFQGLADLQRLDPTVKFTESIPVYWNLVNDYEIFITGMGGLRDMGGEYWQYGKWGQTREIPNVRYGETCITTTWLRFCDNLLRSSGEHRIADAMEKTIYNAVLGAMFPDGSTWTHGNPALTGPGFKRAADDQISGYGEDCCLAQGPEALGMAPLSAVMRTKDALILNCFEDLEADGGSMNLKVTGGYPFKGKVKVAIKSDGKTGLMVRVPAWLKKAEFSGKKLAVKAGQYLKIKPAAGKSELLLDFDLSLQVQEAPKFESVPIRSRYQVFFAYYNKKEEKPLCAVTSGPLVLARDERLSPIAEPFAGIKGARKLSVPGFKAVWELSDGSRLCTYIDAGNEFGLSDLMTVWMPVK